jgi:hypothetical protein
MDERRRLEGVSWRFALEMAARHAAQLVIDEREQAVERRRVTLAPGQEQASYIVHGRVCRWLVRETGAALRFSI